VPGLAERSPEEKEMSLRKRRQSGNGPKVAVLVVVILAVALVVGIGYYGGSVGLPHPLSGGSAGSSGSPDFSLTNATLSAYASPDDGYAGLGATIVIANHYTQKMTNITASVDSYSMGQCATISGNQQIAAGATGTCRLGQNVVCSSFPAAPYVVAVTAKFADGTMGTKSLTIKQALTTTC
jgi:hypothetical protein